LRNVITVLCLLFVGTFLIGDTQAQQATPKVSADQVSDDTIQLMRQDIRSDRKKIIAANLPLTEAEAVKFWPVYDRYVAEHSKIYDTRYALIKNYAQNYNTLNDAQAKDMADRIFKYQASRIELKKKYFKEFNKQLPAVTVVKFYQLENRLDLLLDLQLASELPPLLARADATK